MSPVRRSILNEWAMCSFCCYDRESQNNTWQKSTNKGHDSRLTKWNKSWGWGFQIMKEMLPCSRTMVVNNNRRETVFWCRGAIVPILAQCSWRWRTRSFLTGVLDSFGHEISRARKVVPNSVSHIVWLQLTGIDSAQDRIMTVDWLIDWLWWWWWRN